MALLFMLVICIAIADVADGTGFVPEMLTRLGQSLRRLSSEQHMGSVSLGDTISDTLDSGAEHVYTFTGERGTVINLIATTTLDFSPYLILRNSNAQELVFDSGLSGQNAPICQYTLPYNGAYQVLVGGVGSAGRRDYQLSLSEVNMEGEQPLEIGEIVTGVLSLCEEQHFRVRVNQGATVTITTRSERETNVETEMLNEAGQIVASFNNRGSLEPTIQYESFYADQNFTIVVQIKDGDAGGFSLRVAETRR